MSRLEEGVSLVPQYVARPVLRSLDQDLEKQRLEE